VVSLLKTRNGWQKWVNQNKLSIELILEHEEGMMSSISSLVNCQIDANAWCNYG
jgi:hypothetical protein